jgi:hypothetical protein
MNNIPPKQIKSKKNRNKNELKTEDFSSTPSTEGFTSDRHQKEGDIYIYYSYCPSNKNIIGITLDSSNENMFKNIFKYKDTINVYGLEKEWNILNDSECYIYNEHIYIPRHLQIPGGNRVNEVTDVTDIADIAEKRIVHSPVNCWSNLEEFLKECYITLKPRETIINSRREKDEHNKQQKKSNKPKQLECSSLDPESRERTSTIYWRTRVFCGSNP